MGSTLDKPGHNKTETILVIVVGLLGLEMIFDSGVLRFIALGIGVLSIFSTVATNWIDFLWGKLAAFLGLIFPNVFLTLFFLLFLTPLAFFAKMFSKEDVLFVKRPLKTTFKTRNKEFKKETFEELW
jgi:hypothetical protein